MSYIFVSSFDTLNVNNFNSIFNDCFLLCKIDLSNLDLSSANDMNYLFSNYISLLLVDLQFGMDQMLI